MKFDKFPIQSVLLAVTKLLIRFFFFFFFHVCKNYIGSKSIFLGPICKTFIVESNEKLLFSFVGNLVTVNFFFFFFPSVSPICATWEFEIHA